MSADLSREALLLSKLECYRGIQRHLEQRLREQQRLCLEAADALERGFRDTDTDELVMQLRETRR